MQILANKLRRYALDDDLRSSTLVLRPSFLPSFLCGKEERVSLSKRLLLPRRCCYEGVKLHPSVKTLSKTERVKSPEDLGRIRPEGVSLPRRGAGLNRVHVIQSGNRAFAIFSPKKFSQTRRAKIKGPAVRPRPRRRRGRGVVTFTEAN